MDKSARVWPYLLAVLMLPLIVLWRQDSMLFPPLGEIDRWVYLGFFRNLINFKQALFPGTYYGSRLSWILPGYAIHALFSPVTAYYILHLMVHSVATVSFFTILRHTAGVRSAFLATLVFGVNPLLWFATGSDYVDGVGVAFCLLALAMLTRSAIMPVSRWSLMLAGAAVAGSVYSNLVWAAIAPVLPLYYIALVWIWHRTSPIRSVLSLCLWLGVGFAIVTAAFAGINYVLDGDFWFYAPSLRAVSAFGLRNNPWFVSIWTPNGLQPWLWFQAVGTLTAIVMMAKALLSFRMRKEVAVRDEVVVLFSVQLLLVLGFMAYMQNHGTPLLGLRFYSSYLLPFAFLVIGASYWSALEKLGQQTYVLICCGAAVVFGAVWFDYAGHLTPIWPAAVRQTAWIGGCAFAMALILRRRPAGVLLALTGSAILASDLRFVPRFVSPAGVLQAPPQSPHEYRDVYERVMHSRENIESVRNGNPIRFWYDRHDPAVRDYIALNSTYLYQYSLLGPDPAKRACDDAVETGALIVVLSRDDAVPEAARRKLTDCWAKFGIAATVAGIDAVNSEDGPYTMTILKASEVPSVRHSVQVVFDSSGRGQMQPPDQTATPANFPLDRWNEWVAKDEHSSVRPVPGGLAVTTPDGQYAWGAMYSPVIATADGRYRFALRYKPRSGRFAFGGYAGDSSHWLAVTQVGRLLPEGDYEMAIWVDLKRGDGILLRIENVNPTGNHPASLLMEQLTAVRMKPDR